MQIYGNFSIFANHTNPLFFSIITTVQTFIENAINALCLPKKPAQLYNPIVYAMQSGGKRLRPTLLLNAVIAFGGDVSKAVNQAVGLELFHNFTLLHDDVMDKSSVRRGRATVHCKWDENTAILSGDAMLTLATQYICKCSAEKVLPVLELFNRTALEVYEGQSYDMEFECRDYVSVDEYLEMIRLKTAVLLACALKIGAILADASKSDAESIYNYGINLGMAFQLCDDYLDTFGNEATFGKKIGGDILNGKKTWLWIKALEEDTSGVMKRACTNSLTGEERINAVASTYMDLNLHRRIIELIQNYSHQAMKEIERLSINPESAGYFISLADELSKRMA